MLLKLKPSDSPAECTGTQDFLGSEFASKYTQKEKAVPIAIGTAFNIFEITYFLFKKSFTISGAIIPSTKV